MYAVDQDIKMPPTRAEVEAVYPFAKMKVGDSFLVPDSEAYRARSAASRFGTRHNLKFTSRMDYVGNKSQGVRIWRTE